MIRNLLAGLAGASADVFAQQAARKAQEKKLQVDAIQKQIDSGDLTPEDTITQMGAMYDLLKVPKDVKNRLLSASSAAHQAYLQHPNRQAFEDAQSGMAQGPASLTDQTSGQTPAPQGIGDVPTQGRTGKQNSQMAPPIPQFPSQTMNQLALPQQIAAKYEMTKAVAKADTEGKLDLLDAEDEYKSKKANEIDARVKSGELSEEDAARRYEIIGVKPLKDRNQSPLVVTTQTVNGKEVKRLLGRDTLPGGPPIDEAKDYHMVKQGGSFTDAMLSEAQYGTKQAVVAPDGSINVNLYDKQGNLMSTVKGAAYGGFGTTSRESVVEYLDPATGKNVKEVIPLATTKTPGGAPAPATTPATDLPTPPAALGTPVNSTPAATTPTAPPTPAPKRGSLGAKFNAPNPPEPPKTTTVFVPNDQGGHTMQVLRPGQTAPAGAVTATALNPTSTSRGMAEMAQTVVTQIPNLLSQIDDLKSQVGPGAGRWTQLWVNKAGMNDPKFAGLDQDLDLFASALVRTHFGARGGQGYREALKKDFSEAQSPEDLKTRIEHAGTWIEGYAKMNGGGGASATPNTPVPARSVIYKEGSDTYNIPLDKVKAFEASHPNATRQ